MTAARFLKALRAKEEARKEAREERLREREHKKRKTMARRVEAADREQARHDAVLSADRRANERPLTRRIENLLKDPDFVQVSDASSYERDWFEAWTQTSPASRAETWNRFQKRLKIRKAGKAP